MVENKKTSKRQLMVEEYRRKFPGYSMGIWNMYNMSNNQVIKTGRMLSEQRKNEPTVKIFEV